MAKAKLTTRGISTSTVTSDNLAKGSQLTHNQLDSNFLNLRDQTFGIAADDSATIQVGAGDTIYIQGGSNVTTSTDSAGVVTINATGEVTASSTTTFTNKTFDADATGNNLSNIEVANLKSGVLDTDISSVSGSDDTLASAKAIKTYVDSTAGAGFKVIGDDSAGVDIPANGTLYIQGGNNVTTATDSAGVVTINATGEVTASSTTTFTNKTLDANGTGNSITNLEVADLASGVLDTDISSVSGSDNTLASAKAIKTYVDSQISGVATGQGFKVIGDDSAGVDIPEAGTLYIQGGTGITTATDSAGVVTINGQTGDITSVVAGSGLTGGGTSADVTLNIGAGTGIDVAADAISVDVSDFLTNGSDNRVVTATGSDAMNGEANLTFDGSILGVTGTQTITNTTTDDSLTITTTEDSATAAPVITLKRNSGSPADADYLGQLKFKGENDADEAINYAKITGKISDASDSTEDGLIEFALMKAGSNNIGARLNSTNLQLLNGTGLESNGNISTDGALAVTGASTLDGVTVTDNTISSNASNADLQISASGTGDVVVDSVLTGASGGGTITIGPTIKVGRGSSSGTVMNRIAGQTLTVGSHGSQTGAFTIYEDEGDIRHTIKDVNADIQFTSQTDGGGSLAIELPASGPVIKSTSAYGTNAPANQNLVLGTAGTGKVIIDNMSFDGEQGIIATDSSNQDITLTPNGSGKVSISGIKYPTSDGSADQVLRTDGSGNLSFVAQSGGTALTGSTNNTLTTVTGANAITGEANLTFDGSTLAVTGAATVSTTLGVTGASTLDGVTVTDNTISANGSNADLEISANGTGVVSLSSDGTFSSLATATFTDNFGAVDRAKGVHMFRKETIGSALTSSNDRRQGHLVGQQYTLGNFTSSDKDNRFRAQTVGVAVDLNGATVNSTNNFAGALGAQGQAAVENRDGSNAGTMGNTIGMMAGSYFYSPQTVNITNAHGVFSYVETDDNGGAITLTNAFAYKAQINKYHGTITNGYSYYIDSNGATNKFGFYDTTNSLSRFGAVQLDNQSGDPTHGADKSFIYAKDESASSEVFVKDEAGNVTKISPHNDKGEWEYYSVNKKTGKKLRVNMERMIRKLEEYTGESFIENE